MCYVAHPEKQGEAGVVIDGQEPIRHARILPKPSRTPCFVEGRFIAVAVKDGGNR